MKLTEEQAQGYFQAIRDLEFYAQRAARDLLIEELRAKGWSIELADGAYVLRPVKR